MTNDNRPLVVVLSRNYSTGLGVIRSLGSTEEYIIDMVASIMKKGSSIIASSSRFLRKSVEVPIPAIQTEAGDELVKILMAYEGTHDGPMVLFPTDDYTASVVDRHREQLERIFLMPHVEKEKGKSVIELMDKVVQAEMAQKAGLLTPLEWIISLRGDVAVPDDMVYPCFVKPLQSISGYKTEMKKCDSLEELNAHLSKMKAFHEDRDVLVQEYLKIDKEYDLSGVCVDSRVYIPAVIEKTHVAERERGVTMAGKLVPEDVLGDMVPNVEAMLADFRYTGMVDMEFNVCGDRTYFNEVNLRSGGPNFSYFLNGTNLPDMVVKELLGRGHDPKDEKMEVFGKDFVYEKTAWEDYIYGFMTKKELKRTIASADFTLLQYADDPQPGKVFNKKIRLSAMKHKLLQMIGKE